MFVGNVLLTHYPINLLPFYPLHVNEEGLGGAEFQKHVEPYWYVVVVVGDVEVYDALVLAVFQFHVRQLQALVLASVVGLNGLSSLEAQLCGCASVAVGNGEVYVVSFLPSCRIEGACP